MVNSIRNYLEHHNVTSYMIIAFVISLLAITRHDRCTRAGVRGLEKGGLRVIQVHLDSRLMIYT